MPPAAPDLEDILAIVAYSHDGINLREHPEAYEIGRGEQGAFHAELLPLRGFKDEEKARESSQAIHEKFLEYGSKGDIVGMDVARKYLRMGWTRARRYAKYDGGNKGKPRKEEDPEKARAAEIFHGKWREAAEDEEEHKKRNR